MGLFQGMIDGLVDLWSLIAGESMGQIWIKRTDWSVDGTLLKSYDRDMITMEVTTDFADTYSKNAYTFFQFVPPGCYESIKGFVFVKTEHIPTDVGFVFNHSLEVVVAERPNDTDNLKSFSFPLDHDPATMYSKNSRYYVDTVMSLLVSDALPYKEKANYLVVDWYPSNSDNPMW